MTGVHAVLAARGLSPASLSGTWSNIGVTFPTLTGNNEDLTVTWTGGARNCTASYSGGGALLYRINSGTWTAYTVAFSLTSGQTLAWQITFGGDESGNVNVSLAGRALGSFLTSAGGFP